MNIQQYDPATLQLISSNVTGVDFGIAYQGNPSDEIVLIKPVKTIENNFLQLELFLQNDGGLTQSQYRYLLQDQVTGIPARSDLTGEFLQTDFPSFSGDGSASFNSMTPEYAWLDVKAGDSEINSSSNVEFSFVFEYN